MSIDIRTRVEQECGHMEVAVLGGVVERRLAESVEVVDRAASRDQVDYRGKVTRLSGPMQLLAIGRMLHRIPPDAPRMSCERRGSTLPRRIGEPA
jgi:hypothetical protein